MLALKEFFPGTLADAAPVSLILPRSAKDVCGVVASSGEVPFFVILDGDHRFQAFPCKDNKSYKGLIVPAVTVSVDETSIAPFDPWNTPRGSVVCTEGAVGIAAGMAGALSQGMIVATLGVLPNSPVEAAFTRWQIGIGVGLERRVLKSVDSAAQTRT
ncbi:hypothetical protein [Rhizobium sp. CC-YZS058]|uniref:hypothetical protein n=1 Tax=Rhizobium sp. CC-YZS058 TaxID=3042153 RepID=UPI002B05BB60|nr:hypothetical protein [Rhizobium sp. CC-YZS058]MEA3537017.1 hypothetical protein [Rhizobium sp. CC-YZS058]